MKKKIYLANAFSIQMLPEDGASVDFEVVETLPNGLVSAVGHADTARVLGVECSRVSIKLGHGDILYVAQLMGGRLPEGTTTLPEGFSFKFFKITVR